MLLYTKRIAPKEPKKRTRTGCIRCKQKKKKCNEERPECQRCLEHGEICEYENRNTRKPRRTSSCASAYSADRYDQRQLHLSENERGSENNWAGYACSDGESLGWVSTSYHEEEDAAIIEYEETANRSPASGALMMYSGVRSRSRHPDLAMIAPSPTASPLFEFHAPAFLEFSDQTNRRVLVDHFCNVMSHLIVFQEDTGNPFRQLVLPLSHSSEAVMNAIYALSSAHLEHRDVENKEASLTFHNKALKGIAQLIADNTSNKEELLSAIILLVYYEVLVQRGNSNIVQGHLNGALAILKTSPEISSPTSLFLERAFRFYDVVAALSLGVAPSASTQCRPAPFRFSSSPRMCSDSEPIDSPLNNVDTLLGLSTDIWPVIHRLANLVSMKDSLEEAITMGQTAKVFVLREELDNTSHAIELALTKWTPSATIEEDETSFVDDVEESLAGAEPDQNEYWSEGKRTSKKQARIQSIVCNAEAYRHSALVYLYRIIQCRPCANAQVQRHVRLSLAACMNVVLSAEQCPGFSGPMAALLWPLFVASCEAISEEDRILSQQAFFGIERRQGMRNIMRSWEVVQDVWQRRDMGESTFDWRDVCREKGINLVFG